MNVLGLHFGHDAGVALVRDGEIVSALLRERFTREKHCISLDMALIETALSDAGIGIRDIDAVAISSTQNFELLVDRPDRLRIEPHFGPHGDFPSPISEMFGRGHSDIKDSQSSEIISGIRNGFVLYHRLLAQNAQELSAVEALRVFDAFDAMLLPRLPQGPLSTLRDRDLRPLIDDPHSRYGLHLNLHVTIDGVRLPGFYISHHAAHFASSFYQSGFDVGAGLTHDGAYQGDHNSGLFFFGIENRIHALYPHHLTLGHLYDRVGTWLGLGHLGSAGKLMGLAPYGQPRFLRPDFIGNQHDWAAAGHAHAVDAWINHCTSTATAAGYDMSGRGDPNRVTEAFPTDMAASTQLLFEESMLRAVEALRSSLVASNLDIDRLCLSGGTALNCPTNSRVYRESGFANVFVEPGCDDSGLAIGAALAVAHNLFDETRVATKATAYHGRRYKNSSLVADSATDVNVERPSDAAAAAAADIAAGRVIAWYEGRSEIGPRALGHRSILADPRPKGNWARVNRLKGREAWRPFAPAVLEEHARTCFSGLPDPSPFMLFTGAVEDASLEAITHVDGSARVQTVAADAGEFRRVLEAFHRATGVPVVMNTSFNGPGEPVVETPENAVAFLRSTELDVLYLDGIRITRRSPS